MSSLQTELCKRDDIQLGVCFCKDGEPTKVVQDDVVYYPVPSHTKPVKDKIIDIIRITDEKRDAVLWPYYINQFKNVINEFKPDVIEVFGSELYIGLSAIAAKELHIPCCLHIQGILTDIYKYFFPQGVKNIDYILKDGLKGMYSNIQYLAYWHRSCYRERAILNAVEHVIGRTDWDRECSLKINPRLHYHYGGEILRPCFYEGGERHLPEKPVIVTTSSGATYKGFDIVLRVANILKNEMHLDFTWKVYGNVTPDFFEKITHIRYTDVNVELCGVASAEQLKEAMLNATVYVQPSYIENSPNSVAEAQMLGLPSVATNAGGTSSMVSDQETGMLYPAADPHKAAISILTLIRNIDLNRKMGDKSKNVALLRHDPDTIVNSLIALYKDISKSKL